VHDFGPEAREVPQGILRSPHTSVRCAGAVLLGAPVDDALYEDECDQNSQYLGGEFRREVSPQARLVTP